MADRGNTTVFTLVCLSVLLTSTASAQNSYVRGVVRAADGEPVAGATVRVENPNSPRTFEVKTDDSGRFSLIGLRAGPWLFTVQKRGYEVAQTVARIRRTGNSGTISFTLDVDLSAPPPPTSGRLAGIWANELQASVDTAHELFDNGDYQDALSAYEALLEQVPALTSLNLQIGNVYREIKDFERAEAAYRRVPPTSKARAQAEVALNALRALAAEGR